MICMPGKCIKCGRNIIENGHITAFYNEEVFELENGSLITVSVCSKCEIDSSEWGEVVKAINDTFVINKSSTIDSKIVKSVERKTAPMVLLEYQGGLCAVCHKPIGDKWIFTNGELRHEGNCLEA